MYTFYQLHLCVHHTTILKYWIFLFCSRDFNYGINTHKCISPVSPPQLPADEALQCRIAFVDQSSTSPSAEGLSLPEVEGLSVVKYVALSVVGGRASRGLIPELRTPLDGQGLVRVGESLADGQLGRIGHLEVDADEGSGHGRVARQEQRLALLEEPGEPVADGVDAQVGSVVSNSDYHRRRSVGT